MPVKTYQFLSFKCGAPNFAFKPKLSPRKQAVNLKPCQCLLLKELFFIDGKILLKYKISISAYNNSLSAFNRKKIPCSDVLQDGSTKHSTINIAPVANVLSA